LTGNELGKLRTEEGRRGENQEHRNMIESVTKMKANTKKDAQEKPTRKYIVISICTEAEN
jgi:hypothetical protein